jgi:hypothetical protein
MVSKLISHTLQGDILRVLSVFHPYAPTGKQYFNCFAENNELQMLVNIMMLIEKGLVSRRAIKVVNGHATLYLCHVKLTKKGLSKMLTQ